MRYFGVLVALTCFGVPWQGFSANSLVHCRSAFRQLYAVAAPIDLPIDRAERQTRVVDWSEDGDVLVVGTTRRAMVWNVRESLLMTSVMTAQPVSGLSIDGTRRFIALSAQTGLGGIVDMQYRGRFLVPSSPFADFIPDGHPSRVFATDIRLSPNGLRAAVVFPGITDPVVAELDTETEVMENRVAPNPDQIQATFAAQYGTDGNHLIIAGSTGQALVMNSQVAPVRYYPFTIDPGDPSKGAPLIISSPFDENLFAVTTFPRTYDDSHHPPEVQVFRLGKVVGTLPTLASNGDPAVLRDVDEVFRYRSPSQASFHPPPVAFTRQGSLLVGAISGRVLEFNLNRKAVRDDLAVGEIIQEFQAGRAAVQSLTVSPCGTYFAAGAADKTIAVWSLDDPHESYHIRGLRHPAVQLRFSGLRASPLQLLVISGRRPGLSGELPATEEFLIDVPVLRAIGG